jgi:hypothetical protein
VLRSVGFGLLRALDATIEIHLDTNELVVLTAWQSIIFDATTLAFLRHNIFPSRCSPSPSYHISVSAFVSDGNGTLYSFWHPRNGKAIFATSVSIGDGNCVQSHVTVLRSSHVQLNVTLAMTASGQLLLLSPTILLLINRTSLEVINNVSLSLPGGNFVALSNPALPSSLDAIYLSGTRTNSLLARISVQNDTMLVATSRWTLPFNGTELLPLSVFMSDSAVSNTSFHVLYSNGVFATVSFVDGSILDSVAITPSSEMPFQVYVSGTNGQLYLLATQRLYQVYENCPLGMFRIFPTMECQLCPNNSLVTREREREREREKGSERERKETTSQS